MNYVEGVQLIGRWVGDGVIYEALPRIQDGRFLGFDFHGEFFEFEGSHEQGERLVHDYAFQVASFWRRQVPRRDSSTIIRPTSIKMPPELLRPRARPTFSAKEISNYVNFIQRLAPDHLGEVQLDNEPRARVVKAIEKAAEEIGVKVTFVRAPRGIVIVKKKES